MRTILVAWMCFFMAGAALPGVVAAKDYNIKQMTAEVTVALEQRRERYERLTELKGQGVIGENNKGYLSVLKHDPQVAELIKKENQDRKVIYQTIAEQNGLGGAINVIEEVFAGVQREKAAAGDQVQLPDGKWISK